MLDGYVFAKVTQAFGEASDRSELNNLDAKFVIWQVKIWDWFAKAMPFIIAIAGSGFYLLDYRDWNLIYGTGAVFFVTVAITWWFWVIYTVAAIAIMMDKSGKSLKELITEIQEIRKTINDKKDNLNR